MLDFLYSLPDLVLVAGGALLLGSAIVVLPAVTRRIPWMTPSDANTDFVLRMQATLFTMTSLMVAFTLLEAEGNFRKVDALVVNEGSQLDRMDRLLYRFGSDAARALRPQILAYAKSIVADEWPAMLDDEKPSERTRLAFVPIAAGLLALEPVTGREVTIYADLLRTFDGLAESRDARLAAVPVSLPVAYWAIVLFAVVCLLLISSSMQRTPFRATILALQMAVLGAFIGFIFVQDQPFNGQMAVTPKPIERAIALIAMRGA